MITQCPVCQQEHDDTSAVCSRALKAATPEDPLIGQVLRERYQITGLLGKGAMGVVYKGTQLMDGKDVALKVLHTHLSSDPESVKRFQQEAKAASALMHPNIVRLYNFGMTPGGQPYIAMEYLEGRTLGEVIREKRFFDTKEALPIIRQTCEALAEAHSHGVLHRDIKPANIMLMDRFGQENFVVVLDFSISKVITRVSDVETTTSGLVFGSPAYMSPERFKGRGGDFRADIYSMGVIIFQMLAGRAPFKSSDLYVLMNDVVNNEPPTVKDIRPDSDIPDSLQESISRALAKEPEQRHANIKALLNEINNVYLETTSMSTSMTSSVPAISPATPQAEMEGVSLSGTNPAPAPLTKLTPTSMRSDHYRRNETPVFDIAPGYTPPLSMPALQHNGGRNKNPLDESTQLRNTDISGSGRWDKSLIVKGTDRQRPSIRPHETASGFPKEVVALVAVILVGLAAVFLTFLSGEPNQYKAIQELLKKDDPAAAGGILATWHPDEHNGAEQDIYADACLSIAKGFIRHKDLAAATQVLDLVPSSTKAAAEARGLAKQCRKNLPGSN